MSGRTIRKVAIVGAGLVGSAWSIVFARAGAEVLVHDADASIRAGVMERVATSLNDMVEFDLIDDISGVLSRIRVVDTMEEAVGQADYVQESVFERADVKRAACHEIARYMRDDAVVGSSSSGIPASVFTEDVPKRSRFLIAHPINPPHLVPVVELVPAPWTDPDILPWLYDGMERFGQAPVIVRREIEGFLINRLQGALLSEAWALFREGYATAADLDRCVAEGLGLRWAFMGAFETIDLNAPGGLEDYARRLGPLYHSIAASRTKPEPWSAELIDAINTERRTHLPKEKLRGRCEWRDRRLMALVAHRRKQPK